MKVVKHIQDITDEDFAKALECCSNPLSDCPNCPLEVWDGCTQIAMKRVLDINARQKAEIVRLQQMNQSKRREIERLGVIVAKLKTLQSKVMEVFDE